MLNINNKNIKEIVDNNNIVLLDFWAEWCGPCKMMLPVLEMIDEKYKDKNVVIGKINVEESEEIAAAFKINSIPTLIFFKNGKIKDGIIGGVPQQVIEEKIEKLLEK